MMQSSQTASLSEAVQIWDPHFPFPTYGFFCEFQKRNRILFQDPLPKKLFLKTQFVPGPILTLLYTSCRQARNQCLQSSETFSSYILHHVPGSHNQCSIALSSGSPFCRFHRTLLALRQPQFQASFIYNRLNFKIPT